MEFKDFLDNLLPSTKVRIYRDLFHFCGSVKDEDCELFVFKTWNRYAQRWHYTTKAYWELELMFEDNIIKL